MNEQPDEIQIDRQHITQVASGGLANGRRLAWKIPLVGLACWGGLLLFTAICLSFKSLSPDDAHDLAWTAVAVFLGIGFWLVLALRMLLMRDVRQIERLIKQGVPHRGSITARSFVPESALGGASNMTVAWEEKGRTIHARMNDRTDVIKGPVERNVVVLTHGRKRWVGVVVGDKLLLALRPPREYHIFGGNNA